MVLRIYQHKIWFPFVGRCSTCVLLILVQIVVHLLSVLSSLCDLFVCIIFKSPTVKYTEMKLLLIFFLYDSWSKSLSSVYFSQCEDSDAVSTITQWPRRGLLWQLQSRGVGTAWATVCRACDRIDISSSLIGCDRCRWSHVLNVIMKMNTFPSCFIFQIIVGLMEPSRWGFLVVVTPC